MKNSNKKITSEWFEEKHEPAKEKIVVVNGEDCYECIKDDDKTTWYVGVNDSNRGYRGFHNRYDSNKKYRSYDPFSKNGDNIRCGYNFTVKKTKAKNWVEGKTFSTVLYKSKQKNFTSENYQPIADDIQKEIQRLEELKSNAEIPFNANLFADKSYCKSIFEKIDDSIKKLQDAKVSLDKEKSRYFKDSLAAKFSVGDVILDDGTVYSANELDEIPEDEGASGVVCISGEKVYAVAINQWKNVKWDDMKACKEEYGDLCPEQCNTGWIVPKIDLLEEIWKNRNAINESLEAIGGDEFVGTKYWSFTENKGNNTAYYKVFDDDGEKEYTTKDHQFYVCLIREWEQV